MRTQIPIEWTASAATNRLSWSWTTTRSSTSAAMPETTARKALTLGGCRRTQADTVWIGLLGGLMAVVPSFSVFALVWPARKWGDKKRWGRRISGEPDKKNEVSIWMCESTFALLSAIFLLVKASKTGVEIEELEVDLATLKRRRLTVQVGLSHFKNVVWSPLYFHGFREFLVSYYQRFPPIQN